MEAVTGGRGKRWERYSEEFGRGKKVGRGKRWKRGGRGKERGGRAKEKKISTTKLDQHGFGRDFVAPCSTGLKIEISNKKGS